MCQRFVVQDQLLDRLQDALGVGKHARLISEVNLFFTAILIICRYLYHKDEIKSMPALGNIIYFALIKTVHDYTFVSHNKL